MFFLPFFITFIRLSSTIYSARRDKENGVPGHTRNLDPCRNFSFGLKLATHFSDERIAASVKKENQELISHLAHKCYRLCVCATQKAKRLKSSMWWYLEMRLWEVMRYKWGHEDLCHERAQWEVCTLRGGLSPGIKSASNFILDFPASGTERKSVV